MAKLVNIYVAKTNLSDLVERAAAGEEIIIAKSGKPKARLVALPAQKPRRQPGVWKSKGKAKGKNKLWIAPDFDAPLPPEVLAQFIRSGR